MSSKAVVRFFALFFALSVPAFGQKWPGYEVVHSEGNWTVLRTKEAMTDKIDCLAIYRERRDIQLSREAFFVSFRGRGGLAGYRFRLDDATASQMHAATHIERDMAAIVLEKPIFMRLIAAKRLRVSALTARHRLVEEDLDLAGIGGAHAVLTGELCR